MKTLWLALLFAPAALADEGAYQTAFQDGAYVQAAEIAAQTETADALALAARALLAEAMTGQTEPDLALLQDAESFARRALDLEADHIEGRLQLAIAVSLKLRPMSTREARRTGQAGMPRTLAEAVLKADPDNAYAHGLLAVWHVEVVRRGGPLGAAIMGASLRKARMHYARALETRPGDASIHWQYARALAALNPEKHRGDIDAALAAASEAPLEDFLEAAMAERCTQLEAALATLAASDVENLAENML